MLSISAVAALLDVSTKTIRRKIQAGELLAHRIGQRIRISEDDYRNYVSGRREWASVVDAEAVGDVRPRLNMSLNVKSKNQSRRNYSRE
jgi:excisionase family DNA binding protein